MLTRRRFARCVLLGAGGIVALPAVVRSQSSAQRPTSATLPPASFAAQGTRNVVISPTGDALAWLDITPEKSRLIIVDLEGNPAVLVRVPDAYRARSVRWYNDDTLLLIVTFTRVPAWARNGEVFEFERVLVVSRDGNNSKVLMPGPSSEDSPAVGLVNLGEDGTTAVMMSDYIYDATRDLATDTRLKGPRDRVMRPALFSVDIKSNARKEIALGEPETQAWVFDAKGMPRMRVDLDSTTNQCVYRRLGRLGSRTTIKTFENVIANIPLVPRGMLDEQTALFIDVTDEHYKAVKMDINTGAIVPAFPDVSEHIEDIWFDPFTKAPIGLVLEGLETTVRWIDPQFAALASKLERTFRGKDVLFSSWSRDRKRLVVLVQGGSTPVARYLFDTATLQATPIGGEVDDLDHIEFGAKQKIAYQSRDGMIITCWLTTPPQGVSVNKPMVVLPHGGPEANDDSGFDYFAQFLASRGYTVLQPQFRGSTGFGAAFARAGVGEWGAKMQDDLTDGVAWATVQGHANAGNIAIVGLSYGGYAALAGATMTPELYACAASINGVSSLGLFQGYRERPDSRRSGSLTYWEYHMGLTRYDEAKIRTKSPAFLADRVKAPILLMHGTADIVVPIIQSRTMASALRDAGKPFELIELEKDDHNLSLMSSRVRVFEELELFLGRHLKV